MSERKSPRSQRKSKRQPRQVRKAPRYEDYEMDRDSGLINDFRPDPKHTNKRSDGGYIDRVPPPRS